MNPAPWRTLERRVTCDHSPWLRLETRRLRLPDGTEIADWQWVDTPDFVNIAALDLSGHFLCFRQYKYAVDAVTLAIPGGYLNDGEDPAAAAVRELREETGTRARHWIPLGGYVVDGNRGCGRGHFFLATGCEPSGGQIADDLEEQELLRLSPGEVREALTAGRFGVVSWTAALALALLRLEVMDAHNSP